MVDGAATEDASFYRVGLAPIEPLFAEDFESGAAGWTPLANSNTGTAWEHGTPTGVGPMAAYSPGSCYGTGIADNYVDGLDAGTLRDGGILLRSPLIDLRSAPAATLRFMHHLDVIFGRAYGVVRFLDAAGSPLTATDGLLAGGWTPEWKQLAIDLPTEVIANGEVVLEFEFYSSSIDSGPPP
ncbi:MAG: hypothetical protein GY704_01710, partial [Phycisphaeraceae bacterium]|nr:hypothetical protein [Phycisphaeraceae bacterium]